MSDTTVTTSTIKYNKAIPIVDMLNKKEHTLKTVIQPTTIVSVEHSEDKPIKAKKPMQQFSVAQLMTKHYSGSKMNIKVYDAILASGLMLIKKR